LSEALRYRRNSQKLKYSSKVQQQCEQVMMVAVVFESLADAFSAEKSSRARVMSRDPLRRTDGRPRSRHAGHRRQGWNGEVIFAVILTDDTAARFVIAE
jgi:hypothetical protein